MNDNNEPRFGATLYVPSISSKVENIRQGEIEGLGTMVICLEDSIRDDQVDEGLQAVKLHLKNHRKTEKEPNVYIRARTPGMAGNIMEMDGFEDIRGFVIPKATADTLPEWMAVLRGSNVGVMPTIETSQAFDQRELYRLKDQIFALGMIIDMVRIGGNDILSLIGARRSKTRTLYDGPLGPVVSNIIGVFSGTGVLMSSPVLEHYSNIDLLKEELEKDIEHGIFNKTAIHPTQVAVINNSMKPTVQELSEARAILQEDAKGVFGVQGSMCEPKTHSNWARMVELRYRQLGVKNEEITAIAV